MNEAKYYKDEYENLRRKKKLEGNYLRHQIEVLQVASNKSIKQFFDFLEIKGIDGNEFIEFARLQK